MAWITGDMGETEIDFDKSLTRLDGSDSPVSFTPIKPGRYTAVVRGMGMKEFRAKHGEHKSADADGLWTYVRLTPNVMLVNDNATVVNRQDYVLGVVDANYRLFRPDGKTDKSPIFGNESGALFMLIALGMVNGDGKTLSVGFNPDNIKNRVVVVTVGLAAYNALKGSKERLNSEELYAKFTQAAGGRWEFDSIDEYTATLNVNEGDDWRIINVIRGFYRMSPDEAVTAGYAVDGMQVFVSQTDLIDFRESLKPANPLSGKSGTGKGKPANGKSL